MTDQHTDQLLLIDLSAIAHMIWHVSGNEPDPNFVSTSIVSRVRALASAHPYAAVCCDNGKSFRRDLDPSYKAQRDTENRAPLYHQMTLACETLKQDGFPVWSVKGFEADDIIATATVEALNIEDTTVLIATSDKDLLQLVGDRVFVKKLKDGVVMDKSAVLEKFKVSPSQMADYLALVGDTSDNIIGAKGIGGVKASELLAEHGSLAHLYAKMAQGVVKGVTPAMRTSLMEFKDRWPHVAALIALRTDVPIPFAEVAAERVAAPLGDDALGGEPMTGFIEEDAPTVKQTPRKGILDEAPIMVERIQPTKLTPEGLRYIAEQCIDYEKGTVQAEAMTRDQAWQQFQEHSGNHEQVEVPNQGCQTGQTTFYRCPHQRCINARAVLIPAIDYWDPAIPIWREEAYLKWDDPKRINAKRIQAEAGPAAGTPATPAGEVPVPVSPEEAKKAVDSLVTALSADAPIPAPVDFNMQLEPRTIDEAKTIAKHAFASRMFGAFGTPEAVFMTILAGRELGLTAMASLRAMHMIEGKPSLSADTMRALVLKSGLAEYFRCTETSPERATFETKRKGEPDPTSLSFTIDEARQAGVVRPNSGWAKYPADMLRARASAKLSRLVYPDVISGLYDPSELA